MSRNLMAEIKSEDKRQDRPVNAGVCALKMPGCRCRGLGVLLDDSRPFAFASVCKCVNECGRCGGSCRMIEGKSSVPCRETPPTKLVNLLNGMKLPSKYASASFDQFKNDSGNAATVLKQVRAWLRSSVAKGGYGNGLVIGGPVGVGKTYMLAALCKELVLKGHSVRFVDFFQLLSDLRSNFSRGMSEQEVIDPLIAVDVLVIDELGKGRNSEWEQTVLDSLVMGRYNAGKIVVASTNYQLVYDKNKPQSFQFDIESDNKSNNFSPDVFEPLENRVGKRIFSRLSEMCAFLELTGDDVRRRGGGLSHKKRDERYGKNL